MVDQFEELLTQAAPAERARFADLLGPALAGPVQVVGTLRPEFLDQLLADPDLAVLPTRVHTLRPLRREALRAVIEGPARLAGIGVDEELVARLVADTDSGEALPLLAYTLAQLADGVGAARRHGAEPARCRPGPPVRPTGRTGCHTSWPLPPVVLVGNARAPCSHRVAMIGIADPARAETDLAAGTLACPGCARPLHPWGHARTRTVRDHDRVTVALRPRRARCRTCRLTHVLLPAVVVPVVPRRADTTAVIGSALLASTRGTGYRRIAVQLDRTLSTRRWIRAVRDPGHVEWLRAGRGLVGPGRP